MAYILIIGNTKDIDLEKIQKYFEEQRYPDIHLSAIEGTTLPSRSLSSAWKEKKIFSALCFDSDHNEVNQISRLISSYFDTIGAQVLKETIHKSY